MANRKQVDTSRVLSILVCIIFMIFSAVFAYYIYSLQLFPQKYLVSGIVALFVINLIIVVLLLTRSRKWKQIVSGILLVISVVGFIFAFRTLGSVDRFIKDMSDPENDTTIYSVIVMKDDSLQTASEVNGIEIGYETTADLNFAASLLPNNIGASANAYASYPHLVNALYNGNERIILFNESFRAIIDDTHPNFFTDTRILDATNQEYLLRLNTPVETEEVTPIETEVTMPSLPPDNKTIETVEGEGTDIEIIDETSPSDPTMPVGTTTVTEEPDSGGNTIVTIPENQITPAQTGSYQDYGSQGVDGVKPFTILISGIDTYGGIDTRSRSDVNIAAAVNPRTRQIMLVPVPRDSYVPIAGTGGYKDKLTHAGLLGPNSSANSVANALGIRMDAYVKVNFSTLINTINALGGVTVYNPVTFTSVQGYHFPAGNIRLNGNQALAFSRERKALGGGDSARGMNQTRVIQGIINEALKPHNLLNANGILNSLSGTFRTNMSDSAIRTMINNQLNSGGGWSVQSYALSGYGQTGLPSYFMPGYRLSFFVLNQNSIAGARSRLYNVLGN